VGNQVHVERPWMVMHIRRRVVVVSEGQVRSEQVGSHHKAEFTKLSLTTSTKAGKSLRSTTELQRDSTYVT